MDTLNTYWEMAQLAQASYIDLAAQTDDVVRTNLQNPSPNVFYKFSKTQATRLIGSTGFSVADLSANLNDPVGFSEPKGVSIN